MSETADLKYRIAFSRLRGMTPTLAGEILAVAGSEERFFALPASRLSAIVSRRHRLFDDTYRQELLETGSAEARFVESHGITALYYTDSRFPQRVLECPDSPTMLYTIGECDFNSPCIVSVVGTRHATPYGVRFTYSLIEYLASELTTKPVIVSGLAHGIDIAAHEAALRNGLPTVAVLAHGLNTIYPSANRHVAAEIARGGGALLTEYTSADSIHRGNFLARNRIIAAMADCVVVAESALKGGAMVTARVAREYDREVFALPGRTSDTYSTGCNRLIASNIASLVDSPEGLVEAMRWPSRPKEGTQGKIPLELSEEDAAVIDYLSKHGEGRLNKMAVDLNRPVARLLAQLIDMEFRGLVIPYPGGMYRNA